MLYRNDGDLVFTDVSSEAGVGRAPGCMSVGSADLDGNGYPDLYVGTGGPGEDMAVDNTLFMNAGDGTFVEVAGDAGLALPGRTHGIAGVDLDEDGVLDLVVNSGGVGAGQEEPLRVLLNRGDVYPSLAVELVGREEDPRAIGAQVTVVTDRGERYAWSLCGTGFSSSVSDHLVVGLGTAERIDDVRVRFADGHEARTGPLEPPWTSVRVEHP